MLEQLTKEQVDDLSFQAQSFAICNGLTMAQKKDNNNNNSNPSLIEVAHVPCTLFPVKFPKHCYDLGFKIAPLFNILVDRIARDTQFVISQLTSTAEADDFTGNLMKIFKTVSAEGIAQPYYLAIHRSDYMLHAKEGETTLLQQVEINTISSAFGALTSLTQNLHKFLLERNQDVLGSEFGDVANRLMISDSINRIPAAMAAAHNHFCSQNGIQDPSSAYVLFVVQTGERNFADQKHLEHGLWEKHRIPVLRLSLTEIHQRGKLDETTKTLTIDGKRISLAYFRAGYTPNDYPSQNEWDARLLVERSTAVKCPSIAYHLVGTKKMQQVLAEDGILERFMKPEECQMLRQCFTGLYSLEATDTYNPDENIKRAIEEYPEFLLKPQREGGGNLIYGTHMRDLLLNITEQDRKKYILMKRIRPPAPKAVIMRAGQVGEGKAVSEFGVFGLYLGDGTNEIVNEAGGYLLRTKLEDVEDGGVAAGVAVMSSIYVVD